jgi:hypothetical protein
MTGLEAILSPERIFLLDPRIRWTAFAREGSVIFCQMRPGIRSYTSDEVDEAFMRIGPTILTGVSERMSPVGSAGSVESIILNFDKDSVLIVRLQEGELAISVDRKHAYAAFSEIESRIRSMSS